MDKSNIADKDIENNSLCCIVYDVPVYSIVYDMFDILKSNKSIVELYLINVGLTQQEIKDATNVDIYELNSDTILKLDNFANKMNINRISDFIKKKISEYYDNDIANIKQLLYVLNSNLDTLQVHIVNGKTDGIFLVTDSIYLWCDECEPMYDIIMDDFYYDETNIYGDVSDAIVLFNSDVDKVNSWLKSTAKNHGWKPCNE